MDPENKKNDPRKRDPVEEIFEEMQRRIDEMMNTRINKDRNRFPDMQNNIRINFSVERDGENPTEIKRSLGPKREPNKEMLDVIDKGNQLNVIMELEESPKEEEIETELIKNKLVIRTPEIYKELPLAGKLREIVEKTYKNNILELKIDKEEKDV